MMDDRGEKTARELAEMPDSEIDYSDIPDLTGDFWKYLKILHNTSPKQMISFRADKEVVDWFKSQGKGYQSYMNAVLRSYVEAHNGRI